MADINNVYTNLGEVGILPVGEWNSSTAYVYLSLVTYGGGAYLALQDVPSGTALSNTTYWLQITEKGLKGDKGDKGDTGAKGDTGNGIASVSVTETSVSGAEHNYRMTVTMTDGTITTYDYTVTDGAVTSVNGRTGAVTGLAEQDGYYDEMSVGSADQLISTQYIEDSVPYKFRTSGGSADIGDREIDEIVGGTLNWNQLCNVLRTNASTISTADGVITVTPSTVANRVFSVMSASQAYSGTIKDHKYFTSVTIKSDGEHSVGWQNYLLMGRNAKTQSADWVTLSDIVSATADNGLAQVMSSAVTVYYIKENTFMLIDLTAMFGTKIADYIYNLEQSTAGAGVAWFKKLFPDDFYPYSVPTLTHVSGLSSHDMVGFNVWDEEWEVGNINGTGTDYSDANNIRSKNLCRVLPDTQYYLKVPSQINMAWYDINKNFLRMSYPQRGILTTASDVAYFRIATRTYGNTYKNDICINLSWSGTRNGEYEPYVKHSYPLDSSLTLMGVPALDSDGNLYFSGDVYPSSGEGYHNYALVDLGTLTWQYVTTSERNYFRATTPLLRALNSAMMCSNYVYGGIKYDGPMATADDKTIYSPNNANFIYVKDSAYTDATAFKTAMSGVMLVYELATPESFTAQPYTNPQIVNDWGTEEYVSETIVPVGHNTKYTANLRDKLQHLPDLADSDGYYMIQQTGTDMSLIRFRIPQAPTTDGVYSLQATVSGGNPTYTWVEVQA